MEKKIGYTQGTFDMFHIGHLNLIRNAKKHCDYLIVGVNADDLVESYKNKRPIVPLEERAEIVRAIRYVEPWTKSRYGKKSTLMKSISEMTGRAMHVGKRPEKKWKSWALSWYFCHIPKIHPQRCFVRN